MPISPFLTESDSGGGISDTDRGLAPAPGPGVPRNLRLTQYRLKGPERTGGYDGDLPRLEAPQFGASALQTSPLGLRPGVLLDPAVRNDRFEPNAIFYSPPRVDEWGNVYYAVSRPDLRGSWEALKDKTLFPGGYTQYEKLYDLYTARTGRSPSDYLNDPGNRPIHAPFWRRHDEASPRFAKVLNTVEEKLAGRRPERSSGVWQPRPIGGKGQLSLHALGDAIDIDAERNPHIREEQHIEVIKAVTGRDLGQPMPRSQLRTASALFQQNFDQTRADLNIRLTAIRQLIFAVPMVAAEFKAERKSLERLIKIMDQDLKSGPDSNFRKWQQRGFFNLPDELIDAFKAADPNVVWGGEYPHSKDFMHFEYNPRLRKALDKAQ